MKLFSERLNEVMKLRGIKQRDITKNTSISKASISQYLHGLYMPKYESAQELANFLNVNIGWLMCLDDIPMENKQNIST